MRGTRILDRHPRLAHLPAFAVLAALAVAAGSESLAPRGALPTAGEMLAYLAVGTLAALHRPWPSAAGRGGSTLGLASLILPAALLRLGAFPGALVAGAVSMSAALWRQLAVRRGAAGDDEAGPASIAEDAVLVAGAALAAGAAVRGVTAPNPTFGWGFLLPAVSYLGALAFLMVLRWELLAGDATRRGRELLRRSAAITRPLALDTAGWIVGALVCELARGGGWTLAGGLMAALAIVAAEAARNAWRRWEAEARVADLERLQHAHKRILAEISGMGGIAQQILTECRNVLPVQWFQFEQLLPDGGSRSWAAGPDAVLAEGVPAPEGRPRALPGVHKRASWRVLEKELRVGGDTLAIVRLWCDPRRIEAGAPELFATLVPQMASSVHRALLDREAKIDALTGVPVRRILESGLQRAYRVCLEEGWSMAVILCDIDHFKKINDTYGHTAGDEALKAFAATLDAHRREKDVCCRYGGEEFTILLEATNGEAALALAERLRQAVAALELEFEGQFIPLTFSAGVAAFPELHIKTASELLLLADEALYQAKEQGRNRCLLNLGRGAFRAPAGRTFHTREGADNGPAPRFFG